MVEQDEWFELRDGRRYCKKDGEQLVQILPVEPSMLGKFGGPAFKCPKCGRTFRYDSIRI